MKAAGATCAETRCAAPASATWTAASAVPHGAAQPARAWAPARAPTTTASRPTAPGRRQHPDYCRKMQDAHGFAGSAIYGGYFPGHPAADVAFWDGVAAWNRGTVPGDANDDHYYRNEPYNHYAALDPPGSRLPERLRLQHRRPPGQGRFRPLRVARAERRVVPVPLIFTSITPTSPPNAPPPPLQGGRRGDTNPTDRRGEGQCRDSRLRGRQGSLQGRALHRLPGPGRRRGPGGDQDGAPRWPRSRRRRPSPPPRARGAGAARPRRGGPAAGPRARAPRGPPWCSRTPGRPPSRTAAPATRCPSTPSSSSAPTWPRRWPGSTRSASCTGISRRRTSSSARPGSRS